ncbi:coiled-coil protein [Legionella wadsworthii]|uniref:Coiled-coil protein n=1 Tax=Legionella wadsworthii TaxID=28088 RepID=A0A378LNF2_9GAMM|nr:hypothetical protein [Legionella wadsworthii]STY28207.1 coiled-coil protein [Legionella wadsworthii]
MSTAKLDLSSYQHHVNQLISQFGPAVTDNHGLIEALYDLTTRYLRDNYPGADNFKVIQLFRHGECTRADKGFGLRPNANINPEADKNMKQFGYEALLHNQQTPPKVLFSTMTRGTTTAANFIEGLAKFFKEAQVKARSSRCITEIAEGPSGFGIERSSDYWKLINPNSGVKLSQRIALFFSWILFGIVPDPLVNNSMAKHYALETIGKNSTLQGGDISLESHSSKVTRTSDAQRKNGLAAEIVNEVFAEDPEDLIVIGHGNSIRDTLTTFFPNYKAMHREDDELDYGESQNLMTFKVNGEKQLFMLPFRIQVDQHTPGRMNARYVPYAELTPNYQEIADEVNLRDLELPASEAEDLLESYEYMFGNGLTPNMESAKKSGAPQLIIRTETVEEEQDTKQEIKKKNKAGFNL